MGYTNWNHYIESDAPALADSQSLMLQEAKASIKLLMVSKPIREEVGQPYYREFNYFTTWDNRAIVPELGRPWKLAPDRDP